MKPFDFLARKGGELHNSEGDNLVKPFMWAERLIISQSRLDLGM